MIRSSRHEPSVKEIYLAAIGLQDVEQRNAFLDEAVGEDAALRLQIERMIHAKSDSRTSPLDGAVETQACSQGDGSGEPGIDLSTHPMIGHYKLLEQIGQGGMGSVYMAQQTAPVKRKVALKLIKAGMDSKEVIARFEAERQALAMMDHPHIAKVLDGGTTEQGRPYFVMELVRGVPITEFCHEKKLGLRDRIELFIDVCKAVQHAHQKGVIHRDLKPSNLLVTMHDHKAVVKVIDFGVAKALNQELTERTLFTQFSQMIGTPLYMAPEQAQMSGLDIDTRSDIYSLGVVLYELLTGTTPFDRDTMSKLGMEGIRKLLNEQEPPRPSVRISTLRVANQATTDDRRRLDLPEMSKQLRRELDWIVMKALEKDRERRYESANTLAADVQRYLDDEPVEACPPSAVYRLKKYAKRHRVMLTTAGTLVGMLLTSTIVSSAFAWQAKLAQSSSEQSAEDANRQATRAAQAKDEAQVALGRETSERRRAQAALYVADTRLAVEKSNARSNSEALQLLIEHHPRETDEDHRGWEWYYLLSQANQSLLTWRAGDRNVPDIDWSPDGQFIASVHWGAEDAKIWNGQTGELIREFAEDAVINYGIDWHPDSQRLAWGKASSDTTVSIRDASQTESTKLTKSAGSHRVIRWSPDGMRIGVGTTQSEEYPDKATAIVWKKADNQWVLQAESEIGGVLDWVWSDDGTRVIIVGGGRCLLLHSQSLEVIHDFGERGISCVDWLDSSNRLVAGTSTGEVIHWNAESYAELQRFVAHDGEIRDLQWSPDGSLLATCAIEGLVKIWRSKDWSLVQSFGGHDGAVESVTWSPDSQRVASSGNDGMISVWPITTKPSLYQFANSLTGTRQLNEFAWTSDGLIRTMQGPGGTADRDPRSGEIKRTMTFPERGNWQLRGRNIAFCFRDLGSKETCNVDVLLFEQAGQTLPCNIKGPIRIWGSVGESRIVYRDGDYRSNLFLYDVESNETTRLGAEWLIQPEEVNWSLDNRYIAVLSGGRESDNGYEQYCGWINLFDSGSGEAKGRRQVGSNRVRARTGAWSPDSSRVVAGTTDGLCEVFSVLDLQRVGSKRIHHLAVTSLSWHPGGRRIASGSADRTVAVWDYESMKVLLRLPVKGRVKHVEWSSDGKLLAASDENENHTVWDATSGYSLATSASFKVRFIDERLRTQHKTALELEDWVAATELATELFGRSGWGYYQRYQVAVLRLKLNDSNGYRSQCLHLLSDGDESGSHKEAHFAAWTCALAADAVENYAPAIKLARGSLGDAETNQQYLLGLGAILFRAGEFQEAKTQLEAALKTSESEATGTASCRFFLAMTEHRLGNGEAARQQLVLANQSTAEELTGSPSWNRKLTLELLQKEATALIGNP